VLWDLEWNIEQMAHRNKMNLSTLPLQFSRPTHESAISTYKAIGISGFPWIYLLWKSIPNSGLLQLIGYFMPINFLDIAIF
jgi:hypothetical protein